MFLVMGIQLVISEPPKITDSEILEAENQTDVAVVPLALPVLSGPGAMGAVILLGDKAEPLIQIPKVGLIIGIEDLKAIGLFFVGIDKKSDGHPVTCRTELRHVFIDINDIEHIAIYKQTYQVRRIVSRRYINHRTINRSASAYYCSFTFFLVLLLQGW